MGSSFVTLGRNAQGKPTLDYTQQVGFWMRDCDLALWLRLLALHILPENPQDQWVLDIRNQFLLASGALFNGCIPHDLKKATITPQGLALMEQAVLSLEYVITRAPEKLCGSTLNFLGLPYENTADTETADLKEITKAFLELLNFNIRSTAASSGAIVPNPNRG